MSALQSGDSADYLSMHQEASARSSALSVDIGHVSLKAFLPPVFYPAWIHGLVVRQNACRQDQGSKGLMRGGKERNCRQLLRQDHDTFSRGICSICRFTRETQEVSTETELQPFIFVWLKQLFLQGTKLEGKKQQTNHHIQCWVPHRSSTKCAVLAHRNRSGTQRVKKSLSQRSGRTVLTWGTPRPWPILLIHKICILEDVCSTGSSLPAEQLLFLRLCLASNYFSLERLPSLNIQFLTGILHCVCCKLAGSFQAKKQ